MKYVIHTDGAARGKKSSGFIAAAGFVVKDESGQWIYAAARTLGCQSNNVAEYNGLIMALEWVLEEIPEEAQHIQFKADSELMVRQVNGVYKVQDVNLRVLCNGVVERLRKLRTCSVEHIRREYNVEADAMCNIVLDLEKSGVTFVEKYSHSGHPLSRKDSGGSTGHFRPAEDSGLERQSSSYDSRNSRLGVRGGSAVDGKGKRSLIVADSAAKERFAANRLGPALRQV